MDLRASNCGRAAPGEFADFPSGEEGIGFWIDAAEALAQVICEEFLSV